MRKKKKKNSKKWKTKDLQKRIAKWENEGILLSGGLCRPSQVEPAILKGKETTTDLLRRLRNEEP